MVHALPMFKNHTYIKFAEDNAAVPNKRMCSKHHGNKFSMYCTDCNKMICTACFIESEHKDHNCIKLANYVDKCREELLMLLFKYQQTLAKLKRFKQNVHEESSKIDKECSVIKNDIEMKVDQLKTLLDDKKQQVLKELQVMNSDMISTLAQQELNVEIAVKNFEAKEKLLQNILKSENPLALASIQESLCTQDKFLGEIDENCLVPCFEKDCFIYDDKLSDISNLISTLEQPFEYRDYEQDEKQEEDKDEDNDDDDNDDDDVDDFEEFSKPNAEENKQTQNAVVPPPLPLASNSNNNFMAVQNQVSSSSSAMWTLNPAKKNAKLTLSHDNMRVTHNYGPVNNASVIGTRVMSSGVHIWEVTIHMIDEYVVVVVVTKQLHKFLTNKL